MAVAIYMKTEGGGDVSIDVWHETPDVGEMYKYIKEDGPNFGALICEYELAFENTNDAEIKRIRTEAQTAFDDLWNEA